MDKMLFRWTISLSRWTVSLLRWTVSRTRRCLLRGLQVLGETFEETSEFARASLTFAMTGNHLLAGEPSPSEQSKGPRRIPTVGS